MTNPASVSPYCSVFAQGRVAGPPKFIKQSVAFDIELSSPLDPYRNKWAITVWVGIPKFKKYEPMQDDIVAVRGDLVVKYHNEKTYLNLYGATIDSIIKAGAHQIEETAPDETRKEDAEQPKQAPEPQAKPQDVKKVEAKPELKQEQKTEQKPPARPTPPPAQSKPQEKGPAKPPVRMEPPKMPEIYSFAAVEKYQKELEEYKKNKSREM